MSALAAIEDWSFIASAEIELNMLKSDRISNDSSATYLTGECVGQRLTQRFRLEGQGTPLVLVHGVGTCLDDLQLLVDQLRRDFRILRYDLRGHGGSEKVPGPYTLEDFAEDLRELADTVGFQRAHYVGFSLGGLILQRFALDYPDRVARLGLISAIAGRTPEERAKALRRADELAAGGPASHLGEAVGRWFTDPFQKAHPGVIEARKARIAANHLPSYAAAYRVLAEYDLADDLPRITHETLVATGELDQGSHPGMSRLMAERIPSSQLHIFPGLKHALVLEAPEQLAKLLRDFLTRV